MRSGLPSAYALSSHASAFSGNEFHHIGLSADGKTAACGGLLSALKGQDEVFFFDVSNPRAPKFRSSANPPLSAITDDFHALPNGGFLVTMMGGARGHAPGRLAEFDGALNLVKEYPENPPMDGFNPHGISVRREINLMVTSDFICPPTTLNAVPGGLDLRGSVIGKVHAEGDHRIHVARITGNDLALDAHFQLDFNTAFASGPARPHGIAIK